MQKLGIMVAAAGALGLAQFAPGSLTRKPSTLASDIKVCVPIPTPQELSLKNSVCSTRIWPS